MRTNLGAATYAIRFRPQLKARHKRLNFGAVANVKLLNARTRDDVDRQRHVLKGLFTAPRRHNDRLIKARLRLGRLSIWCILRQCRRRKRQQANTG